MKHIFLYTMDGCPHCSNMKDLLKKEGIEYHERNIKDYNEEYKQFVHATSNDFLPAFTLLEMKDGEEPEVEFLTPDDSFKDLNEAVTKVKEFLL